jgi:hypothetical protein
MNAEWWWLELMVVFLSLLLPVALVTVLPLGLLLWWSGALHRWRRLSSSLLYLLNAVVLGGFVYYLVPAQYTHDLQFSRPPVSSGLGEIHADLLVRADVPEVIAPERAPSVRAQVAQERTTFATRWAILSLGGWAVLLLGLSLPWPGQRSGRPPRVEIGVRAAGPATSGAA